MKTGFLVLLLLMGSGLTAQQDQEGGVKASIDRFFDGFHDRDTVAMKAVMGDSVVLQTIGRDKDGKATLGTQPMTAFLRSLASIPDTLEIEERLLDYQIRVDGNMAHAWTPYEFYIDKGFSHCGVNSFQLFRDAGVWKIIYIVDTRRREGCGR